MINFIRVQWTLLCQFVYELWVGARCAACGRAPGPDCVAAEHQKIVALWGPLWINRCGSYLAGAVCCHTRGHERNHYTKWGEGWSWENKKLIG